MLYSLDRLTFQGEEYPPSYRWTRYAVCAKKELLEQIRSGQRHPKEWRVRILATQTQNQDMAS